MRFVRFLTCFALFATLSVLGFLPGATDSARAAPNLVCAASAADPQRAQDWRCEAGEIDLDNPRNVVRIDVEPGERPRYVISRAAKFASISVGVVSDGEVTWRSQDFEDVEATFFDRQFVVPLPDYDRSPEAVLVAVDRATQNTTFDHMHVAAQLPGSTPGDVAMLLVVALFTGMMLMPILFDVVFFRILREKFILWHAALVASLAVQLVCSFGLYTAFFSVHLPFVRLLTIGSFNVMVVTAAIFSLRFIERRHLPRRIAGALLASVAIFTVISCVHMAGIEALGRLPANTYFAFGAVVGIVFISLLFYALRNGSRTVRYLIVGLSPLLIVAFTRVFSFMLPGIPTVDANELLLAATIVEVIATALGVASRFLTLKMESERVHAEIDMLEGVASQDALTGLLNRRTIDERYEDLRAQGFDTFALIDLDLFKDINDRFGHQTGDAVLVACADAIKAEGDRDIVAVRLGGEEFVLLLRGKRATQRAENLRQAIPQRVAADVPGLDRMVTASMGLLELPRDALNLMGFEEIYARADKLLYEAKASGRNRMLYERLKVFEPGANRRREAA